MMVAHASESSIVSEVNKTMHVYRRKENGFVFGIIVCLKAFDHAFHLF